MVGHLVERNVLGRLRDALDDAGVLHGEEPLGDRRIEIAGEKKGRDGDKQRRDLMVEHDIEKPRIEAQQSLKETAAGSVRFAAVRFTAIRFAAMPGRLA